MECPVPRTSRFAVSRLLRFSVNSRRQPVTARHSPSGASSLRLPRFGALVSGWSSGVPARGWSSGVSLDHQSTCRWPIPDALPNLRCTSQASMHLETVFRREMVATRTEVHKVHRVFTSASKITQRTQMRQVHRSLSRASPLFSCTDDRIAHQRPGHHRPRAQKTGPEVDASGPGSHLLAGDGAVQRWSTTEH